MAELVEFSKILILKDDRLSRYYCGDPDPWNLVSTTDNVLWRYHAGNGALPNVNDWQAGGWGDLRPSILHAMGVEENAMLGYNRLPVASGTAIIVNDTLYIGAPYDAGPPEIDYIYKEQTTLQDNLPDPGLVIGDFIFWGDNPNSLKIGGKITQVYTSSDAEWADGARYKFEKNTAEDFPLHTEGTYEDEPIPQDIYYYRKSWNGKGISNEASAYRGGGFYVMIGVEPYANGVAIPWFNRGSGNSSTTPDDQIIDPEYSKLSNVGSSGSGFAFTDLIRVRRISKKYQADQTADNTLEPEEIIPCTIKRTSSFWYTNANMQSVPGSDGKPLPSSVTSFFTDGNQFPYWIAYYVNPYGESTNKLDKNTSYVIEINERLPSVFFVPKGYDTVLFNWSKNGII
jgi:hypothetical protein